MNRWLAIVLTASFAAAAGAAAPADGGAYIILPNGQRRDVDSIRARPDGSLILLGRDGSRMELARNQYLRAVAAKPARLDEAMAMLRAKKAEAAIPILAEIVRENRFLDWDRVAGLELAKTHAAGGAYDEALKIYEGLLGDYPDLDKDRDVMWGLRGALFGAKQFARLETDLGKVVAGGNRPDAARAHLMRGDIRAAEGKTEHAIREYLRVVLFYERETAVMPRALLKTAQALEGLRDGRARDFYRRLAEEFGGTPEAAAAKGKI